MPGMTVDDLRKMTEAERLRVSRSRPSADAVRPLFDRVPRLDAKGKPIPATVQELCMRRDFYQLEGKRQTVSGGGRLDYADEEVDRAQWYRLLEDPRQRTYMMAAYEGEHEALQAMILAELATERDRRIDALEEAENTLEAAELAGEGLQAAIVAAREPRAKAWAWSSDPKRRRRMEERYNVMALAVALEVMDGGEWSGRARAQRIGVGETAYREFYRAPYEWACEAWREVRMRAFTMRS